MRYFCYLYILYTIIADLYLKKLRSLVRKLLEDSFRLAQQGKKLLRHVARTAYSERICAHHIKRHAQIKKRQEWRFT